MSALIPFGRNEHNLFSYLDDMEKSLFGDMGAGFGQFRTDIVDRGDHYLLQAELPGFDKKDLHIDIQGDELCITTKRARKKTTRAALSAGSAAMALIAAASISAISTPPPSTPAIKTASSS